MNFSHASRQAVWRRRNEGRRVDAATLGADVVLVRAELARVLVAAARALHQAGVQLAHQPQGQREFGQPRQAQFDGEDVIAHLGRVVRGQGRRVRVRGFAHFLFEQVRQAGLRALDARRQHGFLAHVGRNQQVRVGQLPAHARQFAQACIGLRQQWHKLRVVDDGGRRRRRNEGQRTLGRGDQFAGNGIGKVFAAYAQPMKITGDEFSKQSAKGQRTFIACCGLKRTVALSSFLGRL